MASFGNLYSYNVEGGVVVPQTSSIKENIENAFKEIFGSSFSTDETTANGRLIEALTLMFVDVCGVNAQNANALNIEQAVGIFLDNLGEAFGVNRADGETDYAYRKRVIESYSRGSGFASSIRNAIALKSEVTKVVVMDNGMEDPSIRPLSDAGKALSHSIAIKPHSVFISVLGGSDVDIATAIRATRSAGCGFEDSTEYGTVTSTQLNDTATGTTFVAKFYRPEQIYTKFVVTVSNMAYTGTDIVADATSAIQSLVESNSINATITKPMVVAALASSGKNIIGTSTTLYTTDTVDSEGDPTSFTSVDEIVLPAYKYAVGANAVIEVTIA